MSCQRPKLSPQIHSSVVSFMLHQLATSLASRDSSTPKVILIVYGHRTDELSIRELNPRLLFDDQLYSASIKCRKTRHSSIHEYCIFISQYCSATGSVCLSGKPYLGSSSLVTVNPTTTLFGGALCGLITVWAWIERERQALQ